MEDKELKELYKKTFGKYPHHKTKPENIIKKLEGAGVTFNPETIEETVTVDSAETVVMDATKVEPAETSEPPRGGPIHQSQVLEKAVARKPQGKNDHTVFFSINGKPFQERQVTTAVARTWLRLARDRPQAYQVKLPDNSLLKDIALEYKCKEC